MAVFVQEAGIRAIGGRNHTGQRGRVGLQGVTTGLSSLTESLSKDGHAASVLGL